jgi:hypothetical protein
METKEKLCQMADKLLEKVQPGLAVDKMMEEPLGEAKSFQTYGGSKSFFKRPAVVVVLTFLCIAVVDMHW